MIGKQGFESVKAEGSQVCETRDQKQADNIGARYESASEDVVGG